MKSFIALLASTLVAAAQLGDPAFVSSLIAPVTASSCATSDTPTSHDELLEGFQTATTGYELTWTQAGTTANITAAADSTALTSNKPTAACNQAWKLTVPTDGTETYAMNDRGSEIDIDSVNLDFSIAFYVETAPDAGESYMLVQTLNASDSTVFFVRLNNSAGTVQVRAEGPSSTPSYTNISTGTWNVITVHLDTTLGSCSYAVNGGASIAFTRTASRDYRKLRIGAPNSLEANDSGTVWFDVICVNSP